MGLRPECVTPVKVPCVQALVPVPDPSYSGELALSFADQPDSTAKPFKMGN